MELTSLDLTEQQETELESRAHAAGMSREAVVRQIVDEALSRGSRPYPLDPAVGARALVCDVTMADLLEDDIDLR